MHIRYYVYGLYVYVLYYNIRHVLLYSMISLRYMMWRNITLSHIMLTLCYVAYAYDIPTAVLQTVTEGCLAVQEC